MLLCLVFIAFLRGNAEPAFPDCNRRAEEAKSRESVCQAVGERGVPAACMSSPTLAAYSVLGTPKEGGAAAPGGSSLE